MASDLLAEITASERERELEATCRRLQRRLASKEAKTAELVEAVYQAARDAAVVVGHPKPVKALAKDRRKGGEAALLHTSDWQLGKVTASYDADVCERRIRHMIERVVRLTEIQRADHPVKVCHILFGGDHGEGTNIFPGQAFQIESGAFVQLFRVVDLEVLTIESALEAFDEVHVYFVPGNHGRIGYKGDSPREDNMDLIAARIARDRIGAHQRLTWHDPEGWYQLVEIGAYRAMLVHGDQVKSFGGGLPAFGIMRKATAWASGVVPDFADLYMGHFHSEMTLTMPNGGRVFMTPSTESGSEYAREFVAAKGRPGQRLHFIDPEKGRITAQYLIDLGGVE